METKIKNTKEFFDHIDGLTLGVEEEIVIPIDYEVRDKIIYHLQNSAEWEIDTYATSTKGVWYLFVRDNDNTRISINDGEDSFFEDVVITKS